MFCDIGFQLVQFSAPFLVFLLSEFTKHLSQYGLLGFCQVLCSALFDSLSITESRTSYLQVFPIRRALSAQTIPLWRQTLPVSSVWEEVRSQWPPVQTHQSPPFSTNQPDSPLNILIWICGNNVSRTVQGTWLQLVWVCMEADLLRLVAVLLTDNVVIGMMSCSNLISACDKISLFSFCLGYCDSFRLPVFQLDF